MFVLSLLPTRDVPIQGFNDKINHVLGFVAMTLWFCALFERRRWLMVSAAMLALGILIASGQLKPSAAAAQHEYYGELGLGGELKPIKGLLSAAVAALIRASLRLYV